MFRSFLPKSGLLCFFMFFVGSSSIIAFVATRQLCRSATRTNTPCGVIYVACHVGVALLLTFLGLPWSQWCSDWCALGCSPAVALGCVCLSHVSGWLTLVEVLAVVTTCPLERWSAGRLCHRGIRLQAAAASCAHVSCSGGREPVARVQMQ